MALFGGKPKAKAVFGSGGQKEAFQDLFSEGGDIWSLIRGGPSPGYEAGVNRGLQGLNQALSQQGIFGARLGARPAIDYATQAATGREQNRLQTILSATRPIGSSGGGGGGSLSMFGL